jgi:predicted phage terminase large subunit-like protein
LIGTLMDSEEASDWVFVSLPMVEPEDRQITFPISGRVVTRHKGDLLHPQRWSQRWCDREAESVGPYTWSAQFLQSPTDPSAAILRREYWRYWTYAGALNKAEGVLVRPNEFESIVIAGDLAFTKSNTSDRVALGVFGRHKGFTYLLQLEWGRMDFGETVEALRRLVREYPNCNKIVVEKAANAAALLSSLQSEIPGIKLVPPQGSKQARYHGISAICARGEVVLPHPSIHRQAADLVSELEHAGVGGRFDDAADCLALGVSTIAAMSGSDGPSPFLPGEPSFSIPRLRRYSAGEVTHAFPAHVSEKVVKGERLTDQDWDDACFSSIREFT